MKIKDARDISDFYSGKVSDIARQLALAGLAIVWIFKFDQQGIPKVPHLLLIPAALITLGLLCDFLQYVYGAVAWERYRDAKEHDVGPDEDIFPKKSMTRPMDALFQAKVLLIFTAYAFLVVYLARQIF